MNLEELKIQGKIKEIEGELIKDARKLVDESQICGSLEENQIRNVLDVSYQADCTEVIENFIYYQIGRSKKDEKWKHKDFGCLLAGKITINGYIHQKAQEVIRKAAVTCNTYERKVWMQLTRLYLGYLNRYFYYTKNKNK